MEMPWRLAGVVRIRGVYALVDGGMEWTGGHQRDMILGDGSKRLDPW